MNLQSHIMKNKMSVAVFEIWKGVPIIYGMHLKKPDAAL